MINLTIDGQQISVPAGTTVYAAAKQLGIDLPIFCYQDRMPPFGACRVCLVEVEKMGKPQTSCTLPVTEGMVVNTQSALAVEGRKDILEFLLINHPLDCPICDRGGECPLQDQTLKFGPGKSRFFEEKRRFRKPLALGPLLMLDRERCILCARCTRFSDLVSGDHALEMKDRGFRSEVGTPENNPIQSKFIGNTIMICPVGALTSKVYRFRARPWDNKSIHSTCTLCPVGCSMALDSRDGSIMRTRSIENASINDIWLCDKGWFGYEFAAHPDRLLQPLVRRGNELQPASWEEAICTVVDHIKAAQHAGKMAALGGNSLTVEESYLFQQLMRDGLGTNHLDHRIGQPIMNLDEEGLPPGMENLISDCKDLSFAILLGTDLPEEYPIIWLRLKEAINHGTFVTFSGHYAPEVSGYFNETHLHAPGQELSMIETLKNQLNEQAKFGGKGAIFVGRQYLANTQRKAILAELQKLQNEKPNLSLNIMEAHTNSLGARAAGMHPELGPFGEPLTQSGLHFIALLEKAAELGWDYLHVAGANPAVKAPKELWQKARANLKFLVVQDLFLTETAKQADVVLPSLCFLEKKGHFLNIAGQLERLHPGKALPENVHGDDEIFKMIASQLNIRLHEKEFIEQLFMRGSKAFSTKNSSLEAKSATSAALHPENGQLKATFAPVLFDKGQRMQRNLSLGRVAKEPHGRLNPLDAERLGLLNGELVTLTYEKRNISLQVAIDPLVAQGAVILPLGFDEINVFELNPYLLNGVPITLSKNY